MYNLIAKFNSCNYLQLVLPQISYETKVSSHLL